MPDVNGLFGIAKDLWDALIKAIPKQYRIPLLALLLIGVMTTIAGYYEVSTDSETNLAARNLGFLLVIVILVIVLFLATVALLKERADFMLSATSAVGVAATLGAIRYASGTLTNEAEQHRARRRGVLLRET